MYQDDHPKDKSTLIYTPDLGSKIKYIILYLVLDSGPGLL